MKRFNLTDWYQDDEAHAEEDPEGRWVEADVALREISALNKELEAIQAIHEKERQRRKTSELEIDRLRGALADADVSTKYAAQQCLVSDASLAAANELLREWSNFDFDCPDEFNYETDDDEEDGWALEQLYKQTEEQLAAQSVTTRGNET